MDIIKSLKKLMGKSDKHWANLGSHDPNVGSEGKAADNNVLTPRMNKDYGVFRTDTERYGTDISTSKEMLKRKINKSQLRGA